MPTSPICGFPGKRLVRSCPWALSTAGSSTRENGSRPARCCEPENRCWRSTSCIGDSFDCEVSAIAWDPVRRYVMVRVAIAWHRAQNERFVSQCQVGLANGHIIIYFVDNTCQDFTVVNDLEGDQSLACYHHCCLPCS